jgi:hypothetical protein
MISSGAGSALRNARHPATHGAPGPQPQKKPWCGPLLVPGAAVWGGVTGLGAKLIDGGELTLAGGGVVCAGASYLGH